MTKAKGVREPPWLVSIVAKGKQGITDSQEPSATVALTLSCYSSPSIDRKIRCDSKQPACSTCERLGKKCDYEPISEWVPIECLELDNNKNAKTDTYLSLL